MKVWAVSNQKGGVGKTTTVATLAGILASRGKRVLMLDLDPHGSLTSYFGGDPDLSSASIYNLFQHGPECADTLVQETGIEGLHLIHAATAMATLDRQVGASGGKGLVISQGLAQLYEQYDYALLDCPPILGVLMVNALAACEHLFIPVQTEFLALKGLERMLKTLTMVVKAKQMTLAYTILPTMFDRRTRASIKSLRSLRENYADTISPHVIPVDTQFRDASQAGKPLSMINPSARGAVAYTHILEEMIPIDDSLRQRAFAS
ncbi:MAG: cobalamin biosynthesis protein CobQ [Gammaproteobacteria bacterium]|nr:ParA family protein [Gammaproteobacteria bacterium]PCH62723.1 MAG: cobalamin biosynthesis protein CobQ [Gammaproteobacteria bacterium]PCH64168.1 MAG: cobalamin biosynthesis protein CobQ [Gammaproteobacteria bacterium]